VARGEARHDRKDELIDLYHRIELAPARTPWRVTKQGPRDGPPIRLKRAAEACG
jgi:hypothetical protein